MAVRFEYCECGCKGFEVKLGSLDYWVYNDLKGNFYVYRGHGYHGQRFGRAASMEQAGVLVADDARPKLVKEAEEITKALEAVG